MSASTTTPTARTTATARTTTARATGASRGHRRTRGSSAGPRAWRGACGPRRRPHRPVRGSPLAPSTGLLILINAAERRQRFKLPDGTWREILHAARKRLRSVVARAALLAPFTLVVLEETPAR